jgi:hypothetical protein
MLVISRSWLPSLFGEAEAYGNNRRHEDNFYRRGVGKQSIRKTTLSVCWKSQRNCVLLMPSSLTSIAPQNAENSAVTNSLPLKLKNSAKSLFSNLLSQTDENLKYILFIMTAMMLFPSSCASRKSIENCEVKEILKVTVESDDLYYMHIKFSRCVSKELRENLIKEELRNRFPLIGNRMIYVKEYLGKMYNEYKYEIKVD